MSQLAGADTRYMYACRCMDEVKESAILCSGKYNCIALCFDADFWALKLINECNCCLVQLYR